MQRRSKRIGPIQQAIIDHMKGCGGVHVYIGPGTKSNHLLGLQLEEVMISMKKLIARGLVKEVKPGFYSFP